MASRYGLAPADLVERFSARTLTELTDGATSFDATIVEKQIAAEENDFEGFAGAYYALPVRTASNAIPPIVRERLLDGVAIRLLKRKPEFMMEGGQMSAYWKSVMKELADWKLAIASHDREARIPDAVEREVSSASFGTAAVTSDTPRFTRERMKGF